jgi:two-component system, response regulator FlrC
MNTDTVNSERVLIVEDDVALREALQDTLRAAEIGVVGAADGAQALTCIEQEHVGLVICDVQMPGVNGYELLTLIKRRRPDLPVVLMTAYGSVSKAVAAMRDGATDYILKPFDAETLIEMARRLLAQRVASDELLAIDPTSKQLLAFAQRVAMSGATALLTGESGTGKEVYARFIHQQSSRADKPFVAINCAAIPDNMLEALLFGYEKGAFTGAQTAHAGKFEQAQGGTLLLDEISEMDLQLQAKILRVLQEREVERLGGTRTLALDVRVIATSNRELPIEVQAGRFRSDLYYRLNVMQLRIPPLRERRGDILPLARKALADAARNGQAMRSLTRQAEAKLQLYRWPGNVRELANVVQRAALLSATAQIDAAAIEIEADIAEDLSPLAEATVAAEVAGLGRDLKDRERELILGTLRVTAGSRKLAAERLGISARTLRYKLQQLRESGVDVPDGREAPRPYGVTAAA